MNSTKPTEQLSQMMYAYWVSQSIYVAAKLRIADQLVDGPASVVNLANAVQANENNLYRLLRGLASVGIFEELDNRTFQLTPMAEQLRSDVDGSQWALAVMLGQENYRAWGDLLHTVKTGELAFDHVFGSTIFEHLQENPDSAAVFNQAMMSSYQRDSDSLVALYDFSQDTTVMDIGGGNGTLLSAVLRRNPNLKGVLFELPHVLDRARKNFERNDVADRAQAVSGSFLDEVPGGADTIMMRHVIHNWGRDEAIKILQNCSAALPSNGKILILETIIPTGDDGSFAKLRDLSMMLLVGGEERTEAEYRDILQAAGFGLERVIPTETEGSILVAAKLDGQPTPA